jgi:hypothetical protein
MIFTAFNLRRIFNLIGPENLQHFLREVNALFFGLRMLRFGSFSINAKLPGFSSLRLNLLKNHAIYGFI